MRAIRPILMCLAVVSTTALAETKDPAPTKVELNDKKADVTVLKDASGGVYVVVGGATGEMTDRQVFYGKGKKLYLQDTSGGGRDGTTNQWDVVMWAPRIGKGDRAIIYKKSDGSFERDCKGKDDAVLTEVTGDKAHEVLTKSQFLSSFFVRAPQRLGRDDTGVYYYVDRLRKNLGGQGFRLYVGKKGALKEVPITDVTTDTRGEVYTTKTGTLSVSLDSKESENGVATVVVNETWIRGERRTTLATFDLSDGYQSDELIFRGLGLYGQLGTVCDDI
jgi:hypothetical protein